MLRWFGYTWINISTTILSVNPNQQVTDLEKWYPQAIEICLTSKLLYLTLFTFSQNRAYPFDTKYYNLLNQR